MNLATLAAVLLHAASASARLREAKRHSAMMEAVLDNSDSCHNQRSELQERLLTLKTVSRVTLNFATPYLLVQLQHIFLYRFITTADMLALLFFLAPVTQLLILGENHQLLEKLKASCSSIFIKGGKNIVEPSRKLVCFTVPVDDMVVIDLEEHGGC